MVKTVYMDFYHKNLWYLSARNEKISLKAMIVLLYEYLDESLDHGTRGTGGNRGITFNVPLAKIRRRELLPDYIINRPRRRHKKKSTKCSMPQ